MFSRRSAFLPVLLSVMALVIWCYRNCGMVGLPAVALGIAMNMLPMARRSDAEPYCYAGAPGLAGAARRDTGWPIGMAVPIGASVLGAQPRRLWGAIWGFVWILVDNSPERVYSMRNTRPIEHEVCAQLIPGQSARPVLTRLALLAAANPAVAESLLRNTLDTGAVHPHYAFVLDARDQAILEAVRSQSSTVGEFLSGLADAVDGTA